MLISINNPVQATVIFSLILAVILLFSAKSRSVTEWLPPSLTTELKGLAILMIVLSHIGYFLVTDHQFLWPLSIMAGVGVNLFLFLSGYGITASQIKKGLTIGQFYRRRLLKLFIPFWLMFAAFLLMDTFILHLTRSWQFTVPALFGAFTHADLYQDFNSPLWYFTFIIGYYLLFPLVFFKKRPWLSAVILYLLGALFLWWSPVFSNNVIYLYRVHIIAFPLGVLTAWLVTKIQTPVVRDKLLSGWKHYAVIALLLAVFVFSNIDSGVGQSGCKEQLMSMLAALAICGVFILKKVEFRLLSLFGLYSYEIYLWHWPLMYRYDIFYRFLSPDWVWLATILYLALFIGIGWLVSKVAEWFSSCGKVQKIAK